LAGDRLRKKGDSGTFVTKVRAFKPRKNLFGAMVGAGTAGFIDAVYDGINVRIPGQGGRDSEIIPVSIPRLIRSRFRDEAGQ
jgi:hypothetical protein